MGRGKVLQRTLPHKSKAGLNYVGRFAPSPTGALHFGSLVTAVASYLDAKGRGGQWLLRMDDLDTERTVEGAAEEILRDLELFGLEWDAPVTYQTQRSDLYRSAFERLKSAGLVYPCACSRRETVGRYLGACSNGLKLGQSARSWRLRVPASTNISFEDRVQGFYSQNVQTEVGDFIVRRADGPFSYQLAVIIDDAAQGVTDVVRGADLLDNAPRQIYLQGCLGLRTPRYAHIPIASDKDGVKLSKSTGAAALDRAAPASELSRALVFLGHEPPTEKSGSSVRDLLTWALHSWSLSRVPQLLTSRSERPVE